MLVREMRKHVLVLSGAILPRDVVETERAVLQEERDAQGGPHEPGVRHPDDVAAPYPRGSPSTVQATCAAPPGISRTNSSEVGAAEPGSGTTSARRGSVSVSPTHRGSFH